MSRRHRGAMVHAISTAKRNNNVACELHRSRGKALPRQGSAGGNSISWATRLIANQHGLVVQASATPATGGAGRQAALAMIDRRTTQAQRAVSCSAPTKLIGLPKI